MPLIVLLLCSLAAHGQPRTVSDAEVMEVHQSALLIDTHNDVTSETIKGFDIGRRSSQHHTDIPRLREGGVGAVFFAVYVAADYATRNRAAHRTLEMIDTVRHDIIGRYPSHFELATSADGIVAARKSGRIAALLGIEGGHAIEDNLRLLRTYYALGIRYMTLTHSNNNSWADSSGSLPSNKGLTAFGKEVVREMNRLGMMVDISHVSDETFRDALETSSAPVFASHSSCRAIAPIPRNMTDEMIVALAKKGGVIQINFGCSFVSPAAAAQSVEAARKLREIEKQFASDPVRRAGLVKRLRAEERSRAVRANLSDVVAHIDHVVKIAGIDAAGIGSDYDGVFCVPSGLDDVSKFPALTRALLEKGYPAESVRKIYGGNMLRFMRVVEKARAAPR